jgi:hypothetical protein
LTAEELRLEEVRSKFRVTVDGLAPSAAGEAR